MPTQTTPSASNATNDPRELSEKRRLRWGILGAGAIARAFVKGLTQSQTGRAFAVGSRDLAKAQSFAKDHGVERAHGDYDALLHDPDVDAVYICTPHPGHAQWTIRALEAGKHVLCEKPFAMNAAQAMAMADAANVNGRFLMEAFMYRCHPQTLRLTELIAGGAIGQIRVIRASFSFQTPFNASSRLYDNALGGGAILDVGAYAVSISRLIAGAALGTGIAEPIDVSGNAHLGPTGVDHWAIGTLRFRNDILSQISTGIEVNQDNSLVVFGSEGVLRVPNPFVANRANADIGKILIERYGQATHREERVDAGMTSFGYEADAFTIGVETGVPPFPAPTLADTLGNMRVLDRWRAACGLAYNEEKPEIFPRTTVRGAPLSRLQPAPIPTGSIQHVDRPVSRLIMGVDNQPDLPHAALMFDDYFAKGGNTFDTAHIYAGGRLERLLGQWLKLRGVRDQVNVIVKGCHSPYAYPDVLDVQLRESLERLGIERADIYMMHRDNPDVPVADWIERLNAHVKAGRISAFGGSNWSIERVQAANDYAASRGLQGFSVVSNNFSLARMVNPIWKGSLSTSDSGSRAWFTQTQTALLAWSSQARGFFVPGRAAPDKTDDAELVHTWYAADNFDRQKRAFELAKRKNVSPINIALAYVLSQPFPTFALIGPRTLEETRTSLPGLAVTLTPDELRWLNLEA